jgi:hypothetical protein
VSIVNNEDAGLSHEQPISGKRPTPSPRKNILATTSQRLVQIKQVIGAVYHFVDSNRTCMKPGCHARRRHMCAD